LHGELDVHQLIFESLTCAGGLRSTTLHGVGTLLLAQEFAIATANAWPISGGTINDEDVWLSSGGAFSSAHLVS
jgi:hypothetical protein